MTQGAGSVVFRGGTVLTVDATHRVLPDTDVLVTGDRIAETGVNLAVPEGTRLHADFEPTPHGWFRLAFPLFLVIMRREERANMSHLRDAVERRTPARE